MIMNKQGILVAQGLEMIYFASKFDQKVSDSKFGVQSARVAIAIINDTKSFQSGLSAGSTGLL